VADATYPDGRGLPRPENLGFVWQNQPFYDKNDAEMEKFVRKYSDARRGIVKTDAQIAMEAAKEKAALEASWNKKWY
jgi:ABC-type nitrate/sulfonate/bicarbonate transport system substrate-binding protein